MGKLIKKGKRIKKKEHKIYPNLEDLLISTVNDLDLTNTYSYANYLRWEFEDRLELIKGKIFKMYAPTVNHQRLTGRIYGELYQFLKGKRCEAFVAPFDVRFPDLSIEDNNIYTVLQPDVCVVCNQNKLDTRGCIGAPDIVIEVLSPSNNKKDLKYKYAIYEQHQVKEYWIVEPVKKHFLKFILQENGLFEADEPSVKGSIFTSTLLPGFSINVDEVFK